MAKTFVALIVALILSAFSYAFAHGFLNWYLTGFDDLIIFAGTYAYASRRGTRLAALSGLLLAVILMIAIVAIAGIGTSKIVPDVFSWIGVAVPLSLAFIAFRNRNSESSEEHFTRPWWTSHGTFLMAFFGFIMNSTDDIALNTSTVFSNYSMDGGPQYLFGVFFGAIAMSVIVSESGKKISEYVGWKTQVASYLVAAGIIIGNLI